MTTRYREGNAQKHFSGLGELRVLHVIPSLSSVHGGPTRAMYQILQAMAGTEIVMEVATTDDDGYGKRIDPNVMAASAKSAPIMYFRKVLEFYKVAPRFAFWFWRRARDYDVIHVHALFSFLSVLAAAIALLRRVPYVLRPLGTLSTYGLAKRRPFLKRASITLVEGPLLRHAAVVHFTSALEQHEAELLSIQFRSVVIPLAVEIPSAPLPLRSESSSRLADRPFTALYLSRLDPKKNVEGLLRALRIVVEILPSVRLVIAGNGNGHYVATLRQLACDLGISSAVVWAGYVDGEAKAALLRDAHLFVLPSYSENFGIAVAEALAVGLPCVVSTGVAISSEISEYGAGVVVSTEPDSIAKAIVHLLSNVTARQLAADNALRLAREQFSNEVMCSRLSALYNNVARRRDAVATSSAVA